MKSLIAEINKVNQSLLIGVEEACLGYGLVKSIKSGGENLNVLYSSDEKVVYPDDSVKCFFYHKLNSERYTEVQGPGKKKIYNANANISLYCWADEVSFHDHLITRFGSTPKVTLIESDFDAYKIVNAEISKKEYDFSKNIFVVKYQLLYKTDCYEATCQ